jgi:hypothetical protein
MPFVPGVIMPVTDAATAVRVPSHTPLPPLTLLDSVAGRALADILPLQFAMSPPLTSFLLHKGTGDGGGGSGGSGSGGGGQGAGASASASASARDVDTKAVAAAMHVPVPPGAGVEVGVRAVVEGLRSLLADPLVAQRQV